MNVASLDYVWESENTTKANRMGTVCIDFDQWYR